MTRAGACLLQLEVGICFAPAFLGVTLGAAMSMTPAKVGSFSLTGMLEAALLLLVLASGMVAAGSMLRYVLTGDRTLPRGAMAICSATGLLISGGVSYELLSAGLRGFVFICGAPFLCGLHLLYLGRGYFSADDPRLGKRG